MNASLEYRAATLARIVRVARQRAFDREATDPHRCARIVDKVKARVPRFVPSAKLDALMRECTARRHKAEEVGAAGMRRGEDRAFRASRRAWERVREWEERHVSPLYAAELATYRGRPDVAPYHAAGLV